MHSSKRKIQRQNKMLSKMSTRTLAFKLRDSIFENTPPSCHAKGSRESQLGFPCYSPPIPIPFSIVEQQTFHFKQIRDFWASFRWRSLVLHYHQAARLSLLPSFSRKALIPFWVRSARALWLGCCCHWENVHFASMHFTPKLQLK